MCLASCQDPALTADYGDTLVYMPQATHNLGVDNNLEVTIKLSDVTADPGKKSQTTLGIFRSGTAAKESFSVDLHVVADTLAAAKAMAAHADAPAKYDIYKTAELLPENCYDALPGTLTVPEGKREATTQLVLHDKEIFDNFPIGQILCLPVRIDNPTKYTLNESLALTMVVVKLAE